MIMPRHAPPGAYIDDPAETIDRADHAESNHALTLALASDGLHPYRRVDHARAGRGQATGLALGYCPSLHLPTILPCKRPSAAWVARQHGVSRQRASLSPAGICPRVRGSSPVSGPAFSQSGQCVLKSDGAGCGRERGSRSPARSQAHSPTPNPPRCRRHGGANLAGES